MKVWFISFCVDFRIWLKGRYLSYQQSKLRRLRLQTNSAKEWLNYDLGRIESAAALERITVRKAWQRDLTELEIKIHEVEEKIKGAYK